ncbi:hypothetical protein BDV95DRAFT_139922 [Massariosphaeria phaeospora]|uniref:Uncharacterized protein n=1 Tax=Massariosphaeria phaeospora TaxID=100035 RepID=A0A7C8MUB5_9PLEO|nr:hypothetical protein BDV95DRAFT_139922 [Massariosphaeria phaeospora]
MQRASLTFEPREGNKDVRLLHGVSVGRAMSLYLVYLLGPAGGIACLVNGNGLLPNPPVSFRIDTKAADSLDFSCKIQLESGIHSPFVEPELCYACWGVLVSVIAVPVAWYLPGPCMDGAMFFRLITLAGVNHQI